MIAPHQAINFQPIQAAPIGIY